MAKELKTIDITWLSIFRVAAAALLLTALFLVREIVVILLLALIIASGVESLVHIFTRYGIPKILNVVLIYLLVFLSFGLVVYLIIPPLVADVFNFATNFPSFWSKFSAMFSSIGFNVGEASFEDLQNFLYQYAQRLGAVGENIFATFGAFFGGFVVIVTSFVISFYLSIQEHGVERFLKFLTPAEKRDYVVNLWTRTQKKIGHWVGGQAILGLVMGLLVYLGLTVIGVNYALILAILAALFEIVPVAGPILAAIPAVAVAFSQDPMLGFVTLLLYVIAQQFENHIVVPLVMNQIVGLNPVIVILSLLVGLKLGGILGMILAVPLTVAAAEFLKDYFEGEILNSELERKSGI